VRRLVLIVVIRWFRLIVRFKGSVKRLGRAVASESVVVCGEATGVQLSCLIRKVGYWVDMHICRNSQTFRD
jgi:hypothetical protein